MPWNLPPRGSRASNILPSVDPWAFSLPVSGTVLCTSNGAVMRCGRVSFGQTNQEGKTLAVRVSCPSSLCRNRPAVAARRGGVDGVQSATGAAAEGNYYIGSEDTRPYQTARLVHPSQADRSRPEIVRGDHHDEAVGLFARSGANGVPAIQPAAPIIAWQYHELPRQAGSA